MGDFLKVAGHFVTGILKQRTVSDVERIVAAMNLALLDFFYAMCMDENNHGHFKVFLERVSKPGLYEILSVPRPFRKAVRTIFEEEIKVAQSFQGKHFQTVKLTAEAVWWIGQLRDKPNSKARLGF